MSVARLNLEMELHHESKIATFDYVEYDHLKKGDRGILLWAPGYKIVIKEIEDQISKEAGS